ncbi:MAG TPA: hypothetical protein VED01_03820 [Burkholderiales bacterium]|nr:hypothetical protein [Burkholderiales bacterium]
MASVPEGWAFFTHETSRPTGALIKPIRHSLRDGRSHLCFGRTRQVFDTHSIREDRRMQTNRLTTKPTHEVIAAINALDLESVKARMMDAELGEGWTREYADSIEAAYKTYLTMLAKYPEHAEDIMLAKDVDEFWHTHILQTMKYADDCQNVFGAFLHHNPHVGPRDDAVFAERAAKAEETRRLYEREFQNAASAWAGSAVKAEAAYSTAAIRSREAAYSTAAIRSQEAAYSTAAVRAEQAAYSTAAIKSEQAAYSTAAIRSERAAYSTAAIRSEQAAYSTAAIRADQAAYSTAAIRAEKAAYSTAAIRAEQAAYSTAAIRGEQAAYSTAAIRADQAAYSTAAIRAHQAAYSTAAIRAHQAAYSTAAIRADQAAYSTAAIRADQAAYSTAAIRAENAAYSTAAVRADGERESSPSAL